MRLPKLIVGLAVAIMAMSGLAITSVSAQAADSAAQGIQISPTLVELNATWGKSYNVMLKITNVTGSDLVYTPSVSDFGASDETGTPKIIQDSTLPSTASVITWVSTIPQIEVASHKTTTVNVLVTIPDNAEPGGHYGVISFSGAAPDASQSTSVGLSASAGTLLLVRVGDNTNITEKASLASFYSEANNNQSSFFENGPITLVTRIKNDGNIHIKPVGNVVLTDMFGNIVKTMTVNDEKANVLPNSIRRFESEYNGAWMIGMYTANLTIGYGTTGQAITNTITFWVIPYKVILAVLAILVTLFFIFKRSVSSYNRRIIEKHKHEYSNKNKKTTKKG